MSMLAIKECLLALLEKITAGRAANMHAVSDKRKRCFVPGIIYVTLLLAPPSRPIAVGLAAPICYGALIWYLISSTAAGRVLKRAFADERQAFCLLLISCVFLIATGWYLSTYKFVPTWDQITYWRSTLQFNHALSAHPVRAAYSALESVNNSDYNLIQCWIMSVPTRLIPSWKGTFFTELLLIALPVALLLTAYVIGTVGDSAQAALAPCYACTLLFPTMLYPVLYGYLDEVGVLLLVALLAVLTDESLLGSKPRALLAGFGCLGLMCIRRWFVYAVMGLAVATIFWWAIYLVRAEDRKTTFKQIALAAGFVMLGALITAVPFAGFVRRSLTGGYSTSYASWTRFGDYATKLGDLANAFGWGWLLAGFAAFIWTVMRYMRSHDIRLQAIALPPIFVLAAAMAVVAFWQTQDFSPQHRYIFTPFLISAVAIPLVAWASSYVARSSKAVGVLLPIVGFAGFLGAFGVLPVAALPSTPLPTGTLLMRPFRQDDVKQKKELVAYLDGVVPSGTSAYFTCASSNINSSLVLSVACSKGSAFAPINVQQADVDSRDGFKAAFFDSEYVVAATPVQLHMAQENERVVCVLNEGVTDPNSMIGSHYEATMEFQMDGGVVVTVYHRIRDYTPDEVRQLQSLFDSYYPQWPWLFHDRFEAYIESLEQ